MKLLKVIFFLISYQLSQCQSINTLDCTDNEKIEETETFTCNVMNITLTKENPHFTISSNISDVIREIGIFDSVVPVLTGNFCNDLQNLSGLAVVKSLTEIIATETFVNCSKLRELDIWSNKFQHLIPNMFNHLEMLEKINLMSNDMEYIDPEAFSGLKNLQKLNLRWNVLRLIDKEVFIPLSSLTTLLLEGNPLLELDAEHLIASTSLTTISIPNPDFACGRQYVILDIFKSANVTLTEVLPQLPTKMTCLDDSEHQKKVHNARKYIQINFFPQNKVDEVKVEYKCSSMYDKFCRLENVETSDFIVTSHVPEKVMIVFLSNSSIATLSGVMCDYFPNLIKIAAYSEYSIQNINGVSFKNCTKLRKLEAHTNHIKQLKPKTFQYLNNLTELQLFHNDITQLVSETFIGLSNLKILNLMKNKIESIEQRAFDGLESLEWLQLGRNLLTKVDGKIFEPLKHLKTLNLWANRIESIDEEGFYGLERLQFIYMYENRLTNIHSNVVKSLNHLEEFDVRSNKLFEFDIELFLPHVPQLKYVDIRDNNLECDRLRIILQLLRDANVTVLRDEPTYVMKIRPYQVEMIDNVECLSMETYVSLKTSMMKI